VILLVFAQIDKSGIACMVRIQLLNFTNIFVQNAFDARKPHQSLKPTSFTNTLSNAVTDKHANAIHNTPLIQTRLPKLQLQVIAE
jgi:hypothetical protein